MVWQTFQLVAAQLSFIWKLGCHWRKGLSQHHSEWERPVPWPCIAAVIWCCCDPSNTWRPQQNGGHFAHKWIFFNDNYCIWILISLEFIPKGLIDDKSPLTCWQANTRTSVDQHLWHYMASLGHNELNSGNAGLKWKLHCYWLKGLGQRYVVVP